MKAKLKTFNKRNSVFLFTRNYTVYTWRSGWDSNPRALAGYLISSQARYDHFDTAPYYGAQRGLALCAFLVEVARLELAASWSRTMRATNCATPRKLVYYTLSAAFCQTLLTCFYILSSNALIPTPPRKFHIMPYGLNLTSLTTSLPAQSGHGARAINPSKR